MRHVPFPDGISEVVDEPRPVRTFAERVKAASAEELHWMIVARAPCDGVPDELVALRAELERRLQSSIPAKGAEVITA